MNFAMPLLVIVNIAACYKPECNYYAVQASRDRADAACDLAGRCYHFSMRSLWRRMKSSASSRVKTLSVDPI